MSGRLRQFLALPAEDRRRLLRAGLWLPLAHFGLRRLGLRSCLQAMGLEDAGAGRRDAFDARQYERACRCEWSVALASRHGLVAGTCLSRSLAVMRLLAREGLVAGRLRLGVGLENGALGAHAWVEFAGLPLGQGSLGHEPIQAFNYKNRTAP